jgi:hypothetical protein
VSVVRTIDQRVEPWIMEFIREVYPKAPELALASFNEQHAIVEATARLKALKRALRFVGDLAGECMDNGDVRVGTAAEVAMRHIWRKADEIL